MSTEQTPKLKPLHGSLVSVKLAQLRKVPTALILASLEPGSPSSLKTRSDGTVLDGHHRLAVLQERGEDVERLPREIMERERDDA